MSGNPEFVFGKIAITHKFLTPQQVNECMDIQTRMQGYGLEVKKIGAIAVERGYITEQQLELILNIQRAVVEEARQKEEALRPGPAPEPKAAAYPKAPPPPKLKPPAHRVASAPAARSKIDEYTESVKLRKIAGVAVLLIVGVVVLVVVMRLGGRPPADSEAANRPALTDQPEDENGKLAEEFEQAKERHEEEAKKEYEELNQWAAKNRQMKEEIIKRCNKLVVNHPDTEGAKLARLLAQFYSGLPDMGEAPAEGQKTATPAWLEFRRVSLEAGNLRDKNKWAKAIEAYQQYPEAYKGTREYDVVQGQIKLLRKKIADQYDADYRTINRLISAGRYDDARKMLAKIENYAPQQLVIDLQGRLDAYIADVTKEPAPKTAEKAKDVIVADRLRVAESMFWRIFSELAKDPGFASAHPEMRGRIQDLERILSVLDAAAKDLLKTKGRRRHLNFEKGGSVYVEILDVNNRTVVAYEKGAGNLEVPISDLSTASLKSMTKRDLPPDKAETLLAMGTFVLSRGDRKEAEEYFFKAIKAGAQEDEYKRLLLRLDEKPPPLVDEEAVTAAKNETEKSADAGKLLAEADELFKKDKYDEALAIYKRLLDEFLRAEVIAENSIAIKEKVAACEAKLSSPFAKLFSGKCIERRDLGKDVVEVSYDFGSGSQLDDWNEYNWYSIFDMHDSNWHIVDGELSGNGSRGFLWKGVMDGDVKLEFDAYSTSADRQNIQATICDDGDSKNYLFALGLTELGDPRDLIRRNEKFSMGQILSKRPSEAKSFKTYHVKIVKKGSQLTLYADGELILRTSYSDNTRNKGHIGLFAISATVRFDNVSVTGRLDRQWVSKQGK
jgi:tetratricopeptide (TPR) repeat protein